MNHILKARVVTTSIFIGLAATFGPPDAIAGNGRVNADGTIDINVNFRFPPNAADLVNTRNQVTQASQVLWDASEGQLRFGQVTFTCGAANEDQADMWVLAQPGRAGVSYWFDGSGIGRRGAHITTFLPSSTGIVIAHEYGHLALGLGDEYSEQNRFGACWGFGPCIDALNLTEQNQCLMQQPGGFTQSEFCTTAMHDVLLGDGISCAARPLASGCMVNCEFFNLATGLYETSQQTANVNRSCWAHLRNNYGFITVPAGLPVAAPPAGFIGPVFVENCEATDTVMLILDRSGSMGWNTERDDGEVCGNGIDDDEDGTIDETDDCTQTRLLFLQGAARAWLLLANNQGVRAGIVTFSDMATYDAPFQDVTDATITGLTNTVNAIVPDNNTAIGSALRQTIFSFDAETDALNKTAFLISDGINNRGEDPRDVLPDLTARGIRVLSISTGGASDDDTLGDISSATDGAPLDSRSATTLVNYFAQQWARYRNIGMPVPLRPYMNSNPNTSNVVFRVEPNTPKITLVFAPNMGNNMAGFGVRATLDGPAGPGPIHFDTQVANPDMKVVRDRVFMLVELRNLNPGSWTLRVDSAPGAAPLQTGNLTILSDNPVTDLFTSLDRHVVHDTSIPVILTIVPIYHTELRDLAHLSAVLRRPDGVTVPLTIDSDFDRGGGGTYSARIMDMPLAGEYRVEVTMRTGPATINDPGEAIWDPAPPNTVAVPSLERGSLEFFIVPHDFGDDGADNATPLDLERGCATIKGSIRPSGDLDFYKIRVPAKAKIWINVDTGGAMNPGATSRDSVVTLLKGDGVTPIEKDDNDGSGNGCDSTLESDRASVIGGQTVDPGDYFVVVQAFSPRAIIDPYTLTVVLTDPDPHPEAEANNTPATANPISPPMGHRTGKIDFVGDVDFYSIKVSTGDILTIVADGDPERDGVGTDLMVGLFGPDGTTLLFTANSSAAGSITDPTAEGFCYAVKTNSGTYYIGVRHVSQAAGGTYDLMVATKAPGRLQFTSQSYNVLENAGVATITVARIGGSAGSVTVEFATSDGSAVAPLDYLTSAGTLRFADGETNKTFTVPIQPDALPEGTETVHLVLRNPSDGAELGPISSAVLSIRDQPPRPRLRLTRFDKEMLIAWPVTPHQYALQTTTKPEDSKSWQPTQYPVIEKDHENRVTVPIDAGLGFFRLEEK
jgi:Calx-beta domain-containing protein/von Willebrand factor type A domain-containing protein